MRDGVGMWVMRVVLMAGESSSSNNNDNNDDNNNNNNNIIIINLPLASPVPTAVNSLQNICR